MPPEAQTASTDQLRAALDAANRTIAHERERANTAEARAQGSEAGRVTAQVRALDSDIAGAESRISIAKQKVAALQAEGNFEAAADAMAEIGTASADLASLKGQKAYLERQATEMRDRPAPQDPLANFSAEERAWIDKNPAYLTDPVFRNKVNAAAMHAQHVEGVAPRSAKWFEHIERTVYPERFASQADTEDTGPGDGREAADEGLLVDDDQFSGFDEPADRHSREMPALTISPEPPAMRIDEPKPQDPQQRAIGRGGAGIRSTAAPPSRVIAQRGAAVANKRVSLSREELNTAMELAQSIEPEIAQKGEREVAQWYYTMAHHPSHGITRRRSWAQEAIIA